MIRETGFLRRVAMVLLVTVGWAPCFGTNTLVLHFADSTEVTCKLANEPVIHFDGNTFSLLSQGSSMGQWAFADVAYWNFRDVADGLEKYDGRGLMEDVLLFEDGKLTVEGAGNKDVAVYDVAGRLVSKQSTIDLNALPGGMYVLRVGDRSVKFMVR